MSGVILLRLRPFQFAVDSLLFIVKAIFCAPSVLRALRFVQMCIRVSPFVRCLSAGSLEFVLSCD